MKRIKIFFIILFLFFSAPTIFAQNNKQVIPEGMETIPLGSGASQYLVPKGSKTRKVGSQIIVEGTREYMSRRFSEMETRFAKIEKEQAERFLKIEKAQEELKKEIEALKEQLDDLKKAQKKESDALKGNEKKK